MFKITLFVLVILSLLGMLIPTTAQAAWQKVAVPQTWKCQRIFVDRDLAANSKSYNAMQWVRQYMLLRNGIVVRGVGALPDARLTSIRQTYGALRAGDLVHVGIYTSTQTISPENITWLRQGQLNGAWILVDTEYPSYGNYDPTINQFLSNFSSIRRFEGQDMVHETRGLLPFTQPEPKNIWFYMTSQTGYGRTTRGRAVARVAAQFRGGANARGLYLSYSGYPIMIESNNRVRAVGDANMFEDAAHTYYGQEHPDTLWALATAMSCTNHAGTTVPTR